MTPIFMRIWLMKMSGAARLRDRAGQLAQRLAHQAGLQADVAVAHLALDLGLGRQRRDGVDHDDVDGVRAHEHVGDLERLLAEVGLRDQELVGHAELLGVADVERVLGVDEGATPPRFCASATTCRVSVVLPLDSGP
jgi:hypothetical protein